MMCQFMLIPAHASCVTVAGHLQQLGSQQCLYKNCTRQRISAEFFGTNLCTTISPEGIIVAIISPRLAARDGLTRDQVVARRGIEISVAILKQQLVKVRRACCSLSRCSMHDRAKAQESNKETSKCDHCVGGFSTICLVCLGRSSVSVCDYQSHPSGQVFDPHRLI